MMQLHALPGKRAPISVHQVLSRDFQIQANQGQTTMGYPCSSFQDSGRRNSESNNCTVIERRWLKSSTFSFNQHPTLHSN